MNGVTQNAIVERPRPWWKRVLIGPPAFWGAVSDVFLGVAGPALARRKAAGSPRATVEGMFGFMADGIDRNPEKDPDEWTTGDEPMTGPQRSYLHTLAQESGAGAPPDDLTKADASKLIDELQERTGRGGGR